MVFIFKCFELLSLVREIDNTFNDQPESPSSQSGGTSSLTKSSAAETYYSAYTDFRLSSSVDPNYLEVFRYLELEQATRNFSPSCKIRVGEFGSFYKAVIQYSNTRLQVMMKRQIVRHRQGHKEWATMVTNIGLVKHPNLVRLVGYCAEDDENGFHRLLIYEHFPNGSVRDHLSPMSEAPLPWTMRLKVAHGAANCLAYLHGVNDFEFSFGNFKSSNVLLDDEWNAKLFYSAMERLSPSRPHGVLRTAVENIGYEAPEFYHPRNIRSMSDVWSFGVFLCELITGRCPFDPSRPKNEQKLVEWVKPHLNSGQCVQIVDSRLGGHYSLQSVNGLLEIARRCLVNDPKARPTMIEVSNMINLIVTKTTIEAKRWRRCIDRKCADSGCLTRLC